MIQIALILLSLINQGMTFTADDIIYMIGEQPYISCKNQTTQGCYYCYDFARDLKTVLNAAGTEAYIAYGSRNGGGHYWNVINLNGTWQQVDPQTPHKGIITGEYNVNQKAYHLISIDAPYEIKKNILKQVRP